MGLLDTFFSCLPRNTYGSKPHMHTHICTLLWIQLCISVYANFCVWVTASNSSTCSHAHPSHCGAMGKGNMSKSCFSLHSSPSTLPLTFTLPLSLSLSLSLFLLPYMESNIPWLPSASIASNPVPQLIDRSGSLWSPCIFKWVFMTPGEKEHAWSYLFTRVNYSDPLK